MKRVYLILTLFISSFFFVSINKVKADWYTEWTLPSNVYEIINENDYFFRFREKVIEYCKANNKFYIIRGYSKTDLKAYIYSNDEYENLSMQMNNQGVYYTPVKILDDSIYMYELSGADLQISGSVQSNLIIYPLYSMYLFLDTNSANIINTSNYNYTLSYSDKIYTINNGDKFITVYDVYKDINGIEDDPVVDDNKYPEEKERISNFYTTIATKIGELATSFATNYIFLVIFGIFILIFVWELIRRWLL